MPTAAVLLLGLLIGATITVGVLDLWRDIRAERALDEAIDAALKEGHRPIARIRFVQVYPPIEAHDAEHTEGWN